MYAMRAERLLQRSLGRHLSRLAGRIFNGRKLLRAGVHGNEGPLLETGGCLVTPLSS